MGVSGPFLHRCSDLTDVYFTYLTLFVGFGGNDSYASHLAAPFSSTTSSFLSLLLLLKSR